MWAQVRGVPTTDADSMVWEQDKLLIEICKNHVFSTALLPSVPHWQNRLEKIKGETTTVIMSYCDKTGELSAHVTLSKKGKSASSQVVVMWWSGGSQLTTD